MSDPWGISDIAEVGMKMNCNGQTIRYVVGVTALTVMGVVCVIADGDVGSALGVAVAGAIGYLVKDWRSTPQIVEVIEDEKEV